MSWGNRAICVEVNGTRYDCYCNYFGVEAFSHNKAGSLRAGSVYPGATDEEVAAMLRDLEVKIVAHAHGVDPSVVASARLRVDRGFGSS